MSQPRVLSTIASATEIVAALGFEDALVGRSHECDYPPTVRRLPACSEPNLDTNGSSRQVDERVSSLVANGLSVYRVKTDLLRELKPDVIVTQDHCQVCAVSLEDVERAVCQLLEYRPRIVSLRPNALDDVWQGMRQVAEALGAPERGEELVRRLSARMDRIARVAEESSHRPTVATVEWIDPLMAGGNWMPRLVRIAGGRELFGEADRHSPYVSWERFVQADPDVIVVLPCGWNMARARQEMPALTGKPEWPRLEAVKHGRVFLTDGNQYFNRPGPRLVESAEILAEILHPDSFRFGHEGTGWMRL